MNDFTDEQLRYLCDLIINDHSAKEIEIRPECYQLLDDELTRREALTDLDRRADAKKVMSHPQSNPRADAKNGMSHSLQSNQLPSGGYWLKGGES